MFMKFCGLSVQDSAGLVHQEDKFTWNPKRQWCFQSMRRVPERLGPTGVPQWALLEGCKNCQTETGVTRKGWKRLATEDQLNDPAVVLREQSALVLRVCVLSFRSTSPSWKPFPALQVQLATSLRLWWSFWLRGAECRKTGVGKQLESSWERYQAGSVKILMVSVFSSVVLLTAGTGEEWTGNLGLADANYFMQNG